MPERDGEHDENGSVYRRRMEDKVQKLEVAQAETKQQVGRILSHIESEKGTKQRAELHLKERFEAIDIKFDRFDAKLDKKFDGIETTILRHEESYCKKSDGVEKKMSEYQASNDIKLAAMQTEIQGWNKTLWKLAALMAAVQVLANTLLNFLTK